MNNNSIANQMMELEQHSGARNFHPIPVVLHHSKPYASPLTEREFEAELNQM